MRYIILTMAALTCIMGGELLAGNVSGVREFNLNIFRYHNYRDVYMDAVLLEVDERPSYGAEIDFNLDLLTTRKGGNGLYWDNTVGCMSTGGQVRYVDWKWELGLKMGHIDVWHRHHSEHALEASIQGTRYPLMDTYGIRIKFGNL